MFSWLTFYHQGHEVAEDFKPYMRELQIRIQKVLIFYRSSFSFIPSLCYAFSCYFMLYFFLILIFINYALLKFQFGIWKGVLKGILKDYYNSSRVEVKAMNGGGSS